MAKSRRTGIYTQQFSNALPSVAQVETAIPVFIGYTQKAKQNAVDDLLNTPKKISSIVEYKKFFGVADAEKGITVHIDSSQSPFRVTSQIANPSNYLMYYALQVFFLNGGSSCYVISVGDYSSQGVISQSTLLDGLTEAGKIDEITLNLFPDGVNLVPSIDYYAVLKQSLIQCNKLRDRFTIGDVIMHDDNSIDDIANFRNSLTGSATELRNGAAYYPYLEMILDYHYQDKEVTVIKDNTPVALSRIKKDDSALYLLIQKSIKSIPLHLPPSSAIAGVYTQMDFNHGVWKTPANVVVNFAIKPTMNITTVVQNTLNVDIVGGKSINAIRTFTGKGTMIWGGRTLAGNDNEWRYISVRRFFIMVEESIKKACKPFVFEPNDKNTWVKIRTLIENYLNILWRDGALAGAKPSDAFFVKVGLGETMTQTDIQEGNLYIDVGMSPFRPAEFSIIKLLIEMPTIS